MLSRLSFIRRGYCLSQLVLIKYRPIHLTRLLAIKNDTPPSTKTDSASPSKRSFLLKNEISEMVLRSLRFQEQRGLVKALVIGSGIVVISTVIFLYVFRKPLKNQTVAQVADVARSSLEHDSVKQQVTVLSQELIQTLLSDPNVLSKALVFLEHVLDDPSTKQTLIRLLQRLMADREMQQYVSEFASQIVYDTLQKPETEVQLGQLFRRAILQKDNQDALYLLLKDFVNDEKTKQLLSNLALEISHQVLNDENIKIATSKFVKDVLSDSDLQEQSGNFAWSAFKNALKPKWLKNHAK
ncbi:unnamed protein product [Rotaria magnacalcarata]|uniref:Uncharacterized protein n=1 Tax=Rotaria magnacalcarata TaxID=392030 RepID=A0A816QX01_9BILA|nr:unnamed protein product [Rotaria magnacalcarata]CAF1617569.1 unnamed protein product [Rotaria magnacalcarata]CAF2065279.1 unnamed protein product [Rotaria magnacalcarata]CAF2080854.1 unnamed protein product [Rotaria magnacalcarata]CAF2220426.1 unnamed protein product [Rotaria magnacalcarata]